MRGKAMLVRCWGARGSIPVSGREYLRCGGDTPCIEIRTGDDRIVIIDAGSGIRRLGNRLITEKRHDFALIFTHAHWDHIMGFPFFRPIYRSGTHIAVFGCPFAQDSVREMISRIMAPPNFPVNFDDITADIRMPVRKPFNSAV
jgi:phosphoribosyl 1,2-cyclic phosphodiesterase